MTAYTPKILSIMLSLATAFMVGGCGASYSQTMEKAPPLSTGNGRIFFYREGGFGGSFIQPQIDLNEKEAGKSIPAGFFFVDIPPGNYVVGCSSEGHQTLAMTVSPKETRYVRTVVSMGLGIGHITPILEDETTAMRTLPNCTYTGPALKPR